MTTVALLDADFENLDKERALLAGEGIDLVVAEPAGLDGLAGAPGAVEGLLLMWSEVRAAAMARLDRLRVIGRYGTGVDSIDVDAATERGIVVVNSGHYATTEVAIHTVALALALCRRILPQDRAIRSGSWPGLEAMRGVRRVGDLRAGVIGLGSIGATVARQLACLGFRVTGYDPEGGPGDVDLAGSVEELLPSCDLVTVHVPLTRATTRLLDRRRLALLPRGALLVNTSRGPVVDEVALVERLRSGDLGGAALDVFEREPLPPGHPLRHLPNVVLTPHVAYFSEESLEQAREHTIRGVIDVLHGRRPANVVNTAVFDSASFRERSQDDPSRKGGSSVR